MKNKEEKTLLKVINIRNSKEDFIQGAKELWDYDYVSEVQKNKSKIVFEFCILHIIIIACCILFNITDSIMESIALIPFISLGYLLFQKIRRFFIKNNFNNKIFAQVKEEGKLLTPFELKLFNNSIVFKYKNHKAKHDWSFFRKTAIHNGFLFLY